MTKADCEKAFKRLLEVCAIEVPSLGKKRITPVRKQKREMTGYNCFTKNLYAAEKQKAEKENRKPMSYKNLISMKTWGTLPEKQQNTWSSLAKQGCPLIPDPSNYKG